MSKPRTDVWQVIRDLREAIEYHGSQKEVAALVGVSTSYLNDVLHRRREPRGVLLLWLGYRCVVSYTKTRRGRASLALRGQRAGRPAAK